MSTGTEIFRWIQEVSAATCFVGCRWRGPVTGSRHEAADGRIKLSARTDQLCSAAGGPEHDSGADVNQIERLIEQIRPSILRVDSDVDQPAQADVQAPAAATNEGRVVDDAGEVNAHIAGPAMYDAKQAVHEYGRAGI
jgi:hypothetical protein